MRKQAIGRYFAQYFRLLYKIRLSGENSGKSARFPGKRKGGTDHLLRMACPALPLSACSVQGKACALGLVLAAGRAAAHGDHTGCAGIVLLVDTVARRTADLQCRVRHGAGAAVGKGAVLLLEGGTVRLVTAAGRAALYLDAGTAAAAIPEIRAVLYIAL